MALGSLTFLVGANGAGKSNFLDAIRLVGDSLRTSLDHALRERGGVAEVRRRSGGHPNHFGIRLDLALHDGTEARLAFEVGAMRGGFEIRREECVVGAARYEVRSGVVAHSTMTVAPPAARDRLYLVHAAGLPEFRPVYEALSTMGFYSLSPERMRELQQPDRGEVLTRDGSNLASVVERLTQVPDAYARVCEYLARVVPGIEGVAPKRLGHMETLEFRQRVQGQENPWRFDAIHMSDGTLRALGTLVALFQQPTGSAVPIVGIEEPEVALHPAALGLLLDALRDGSVRRQVLVTSHSPDLLDHPSVTPDEILAVVAREGTTEIGRIDSAGRDALKRHLYTAGELLRLDQLQPDPQAFVRSGARQLALFDDAPDAE